MCIAIARDAIELYEQEKSVQEIRAFIVDKYKDDFQHPVPLEGAHADLTCSACHTAGQSPRYECADCHQLPDNRMGGACDTCHTPEGWAESAAAVVARSPQIPHPLEERDDCLLCHDLAGDIEPVPVDHQDFINEQCRLCHKVAP